MIVVSQQLKTYIVNNIVRIDDVDMCYLSFKTTSKVFIPSFGVQVHVRRGACFMTSPWLVHDGNTHEEWISLVLLEII